MQLIADPMTEDSENVTLGWKTLSPRELEIVERVGWEMSYGQIAEEIGLSQRTVEGYVNKSIFSKLGINDRKVLGRLARDRGLGLKPPAPISHKKKDSDRP